MALPIARGSFTEPSRSMPVIAAPDVLVVGGGPAGVAAACSAARHGASVMLVDRHGFLGGTLTAVTLGGICGSHYIVDDRRTARTVGGFFLEIDSRLRERQGICEVIRHGKILGVPYDATAMRSVLDELVRKVGVQVLLHTQLAAAFTAGDRIETLVLQSKTHRFAVQPRMAIDASGDADLVFAAGGAVRGAPESGWQPASTMFRMSGIDAGVVASLSRADISQRLRDAAAAGYRLPRLTVGFHLSPLPGIVHLNVTKISNDDGSMPDLCDPFELTFAEMRGREQALLYEKVFREWVPGFSSARICDMGASVGIRESRLIEGEQTLTKDMILACAKPADSIAFTSWPIEIHGAGSATHWQFMDDNEFYGIPYGCLVPRSLSNVLVAGRNLSASHDAHASARVVGPCFAMGQAAGTAAALCLQENIRPSALAPHALRRALSGDGAILDPRAQ